MKGIMFPMSREELTSSSILNNICGDAYFREITTALQDVYDILKVHCGPYARNAIIPSSADGGTYVADRFTKDGISIVSVLKTNSCAHNFALRRVKYVGECVDRACHDGTTTSMMFTARLMLLIAEFLRPDPETVQYSRMEWIRAIKVVVDAARSAIVDGTVSLDELITLVATASGKSRPKAQEMILYRQALLTSKGDEELSTATANATLSIPEELRDRIIFSKCAFETDQRFILEEQEGNISVPATLDPKFNNEVLGTQMVHKHIDVFATPNDLTDESDETKMFLAMLGHPKFPIENYGNQPLIADATDRPLLIITPKNSSYLLGQEVDTFNAKHPKRPIILAQLHALNDTKRIYMDAVAAMAGCARREDVYRTNFWASVCRDASVHYKDHRIHISNLYRKNPASLYHPFYDNPKLCPYYTKTLDELRTIIKIGRTGHNKTTHDDTRVKVASEILRSMVLQSVVDLRIGGLTTDNIASEHVVQDVYGSLLSVTSHGVVFGGYFKILHAIKPLVQQTDDFMVAMVANIFSLAIKDILTTTYIDPYNPEVAETHSASLTSILRDDGLLKKLSDKYLYGVATSDGPSPLTLFSIRDKVTLRHLAAKKHKETVLLQPAKGFLEQLNRIEEILPHFVNTDRLIDTGLTIFKD